MSAAAAPEDNTASSSTTAAVVAPFAGNSARGAPAASSQGRQRSTIIVHTKSPLLLATPPQVTRALAYSFPFLSPLSKVAGLVSWSSGDPWESFLLLAAFWFVTLYGDSVLRWTGPLLFAAALMLGMWARRFSSLSSNRRSSRKSRSSTADDKSTKGKGKKKSSTKKDANSPRSLDEIVFSLEQFTARCNILLDPFLRLTDFLSTQVTATSATTRPALIALFTRLLILCPAWFLLTLWPLYIITTRRVVLCVGTLFLSWHSRPARVARTLLWRSKTIRTVCQLITGLNFTTDSFKDSSAPRGTHTVQEIEKSIASARADRKQKSDSATINDEGIRFTFSLYENQRRWIGIGWTTSMMAYERAAWTDDQHNPTPPKDTFKLPAIEGGAAKWRWAQGSDWELDSPSDSEGDTTKTKTNAGTSEEASWTYYDSKWLNGRRGVDGWGRYTRRRKWTREAELVDASPSEETTPVATPGLRPSDESAASTVDPLSLSPMSGTAPRPIPSRAGEATASKAGSSLESAGSGTGSDAQARRTPATQRRSWFARRKRSDSAGTVSSVASGATFASSTTLDETASQKARDDDGYIPLQFRGRQGALEQDWGVGDELGMELG